MKRTILILTLSLLFVAVATAGPIIEEDLLPEVTEEEVQDQFEMEGQKQKIDDPKFKKIIVKKPEKLVKTKNKDKEEL